MSKDTFTPECLTSSMTNMSEDMNLETSKAWFPFVGSNDVYC